MTGIRPNCIRLEASSVCQLKCPSCPTATGATRAALGTGFLDPQNFRRLVDRHPWINHIELSNYGEILLNPRLLEILEYAFRKGVALTAQNGVNFNHVRADVLEGLAKYKFRLMTCSIDGASSESYARYRVNGDFERVIDNLRKLLELKRKHRTSYPRLVWQFVIFGHNEHEVTEARSLAGELGMHFKTKLTWDDGLSPIRDPEIVRAEVGAVSRQEYRKVYGRDYAAGCCEALWTSPQINWDGKVLGCARNFWNSYDGDAFRDGLSEVLNSERMRYARDMLRGLRPKRDDIPCSDCDVFHWRQQSGDWVKPRRSSPRIRETIQSGGFPRLPVWWRNHLPEIGARRGDPQRQGFFSRLAAGLPTRRSSVSP